MWAKNRIRLGGVGFGGGGGLRWMTDPPTRLFMKGVRLSLCLPLSLSPVGFILSPVGFILSLSLSPSDLFSLFLPRRIYSV